MRTNGLPPAPWKVLIPRIQNVELSYPGSPDLWIARTPATVPARLFEIERLVETFNCSGAIEVIEATTDSLF